MSNKRRKYKGASYHVYLRGVNKNKIFHEEQDKYKFLYIIEDTWQDEKFSIDAYCLMDNHYHLLIDSQDSDISKIMYKINKSFSLYINSKYNRTGHLFESAYKSKIIESKSYFLNLIAYIHRNRIEANLSKELGEYKFDSFNAYKYRNSIFNFIRWEKGLSLFDREPQNAFQKFIQFHQDTKEFYWSPYLSEPEKTFKIISFCKNINIEKKEQFVAFLLKSKTKISTNEIAQIIKHTNADTLRKTLYELKNRTYYQNFCNYLKEYDVWVDDGGVTLLN